MMSETRTDKLGCRPFWEHQKMSM